MTRERWSGSEAWAWYDDRGWPCGCNFFPSTAVNATELWQAATFDPETIDRELGWASDLGFDTIRTPIQYLVWADDPAGLRGRFDEFLGIADGHGLSVLPILFNDCRFSEKEPYLGPQDDPVPGVHGSAGTPSPGHERVRDRSTWDDLEGYITDLVGAFADDERVLAWDLYNEPGNSGLGEESLPLLERTFEWARSADPEQPLTAALWNWSEAFAVINEVCLERSDVLSFHLYDDLAATKEVVHDLQARGRPVLCTEWMARTLDSRIETHLPFFHRARVGCYSWGLVQGKTQTHYPWSTFEEPMEEEEPDPWFHDLLYPDGTPYDEAEVRLLEAYTGALD